MKHIQSYLPAFALALIITAIPLMRPAQAQSDNRQKSHEAVILHFYESSFSAKIDTNGGTVYGYTGFKLQSAESSSGAPQYQGVVVKNYYDQATTNWVSVITNQIQSGSQIIADLLNSGYRIVNSELGGDSAPKVLLVR